MSMQESHIAGSNPADGWREAFGRYWSPKEYALIQRLKLTHLRLKYYEVQEILFAAQEMRSSLILASAGVAISVTMIGMAIFL